ncbi:MAG: PEP-CTERM sorting domain-containing protein [Pseudomonadota bacterium]
MKELFVPLVASAIMAIASPALAVPIAGGQTNVEVTADLADLGLTPGITGTSTIVSGDPLTLGFGISGGDLDFSTLAGTIEHEGVGVSLLADFGTDDTGDDITVILSDFVIDTVNALLFGDVDVGGDGVDVAGAELFEIDLTGLDAAAITDLDNPAIPLTFTATAAGLLQETFGLDETIDLTGGEFGLAATAPIASDVVDVPEPAIATLFGLGIVGVAMHRRRRRL